MACRVWTLCLMQSWCLACRGLPDPCSPLGHLGYWGQLVASLDWHFP